MFFVKAFMRRGGMEVNLAYAHYQGMTVLLAQLMTRNVVLRFNFTRFNSVIRNPCHFAISRID